MATDITHVYPGSGLDLDYTVTNPAGTLIDISGWTVTAALLTPAGATVSSLTCTNVALTTWRVTVTGALTTAAAGSRLVVKVTGTAPASATPVVEERVLAIGSV